MMRGLDRPAFAIGDRTWTWSDVLGFSRGQGWWTASEERARTDLARRSAAEQAGTLPNPAEVEAAADAYRSERWLLSAEETEAWLATWGLTVEQWGAWMELVVLRDRPTVAVSAGHESAASEIEQAAFLEAVCSGAFEIWARQLAQSLPHDNGFRWVPAERPGDLSQPPDPTMPPATFPLVRQTESVSCGAAALASVCRFYGADGELAEIAAVTPTTSGMTSLLDLSHVAHALGFETEALRASKRTLGGVSLPAIVHLFGDHWAVLYEVTRDDVCVADPMRGLRRLARSDFDSDWTGWVLHLAPTRRLRLLAGSEAPHDS
jgi:hypothetical protein